MSVKGNGRFDGVDLCRDFSSEPRWYAPKSDRVDAMALFMQGMLGKEGKKVSELDKTVKRAQEKWEPIIDLLDQLNHQLHVSCSFCNYFVECEQCPIGKTENKDGKLEGCAEYFEISDGIARYRRLAKQVLAKINAAVPRCPVCGQEIEEDE